MHSLARGACGYVETFTHVFIHAHVGRNDETARLPTDVPFAGDAHSRREMPRLLTMSPDLSSSHLAGRGNRRGLGISKRVNIWASLHSPYAPRRKMDDRYSGYISSKGFYIGRV